ncbi:MULTISPECIES: FHA domain-containing protein FhaB/FipA [Aestuariimicrobium]|uniref:FHA domain-containing protein FhaB/FipA n=1 Tax=Aestuariimicrobium TaxID=396388 RepID=UPI0003B376BF|nr:MULTISPECIES: FHA domain-containing protein [Aestuariimicrobium]CAI9404677.1 FHA domain-containing protein FhaB [Aestuariimicrobium sp. T2.26MG-19.2B]
MSELAVAALKVAFLVVMWGFIVFAAHVIRADMFGRRVVTSTSSDIMVAPAAGRRKRRRGAKVPSRLTVIEGRQEGLSIPLFGVVGLGRAADSALNLDDDYASTRHAQLLQDDHGTWWLEDLSSTNGTALNTQLITQPRAVAIGDIIRIGRTQMRVEG